MRKRAQAGFTLMEVMMAGTASMLILLAATAILMRGYRWYDEVQNQLVLNQHARETFDILANGARSTNNGNDGIPYLYGLRGRQAAPTGASLRSNYSLQYASNGLTVTPDRFAAMTVTCTGTAKPLPDCAAAQTKTVTGWMGNDVGISYTEGNVDGRTINITITITDPVQAQRAENITASETYRTTFTMNRDEIDP